MLSFLLTANRHLLEYPNGKSDFEELFSSNMDKARLSKASLEKIIKPLSSFVEPLLQSSAGSVFSGQLPRAGINFAQVSSIVSRFPAVEPYSRPNVLRLAVENKYRIWIGGIKSHQCADDIGWEWGCDKEEPFVVWTASAPNFLRSGATEQASVSQGEEYLYRNQTNVMSEEEDSPAHVKPATPLIFIYQVIEKDDDQPSMDDLKNALTVALQSGVAFYKGDYEKGGKDGINFICDMADILMRANGGGDDLYPVMGAFFDDNILLSITSGATAGPLDAALFEAQGDYDRFAIRIPKVLDGKGNLRWSLLYFMSRTSAPVSPAQPITKAADGLPWLSLLLGQ